MYGSYLPGTDDEIEAFILTYSPHDPDYVWEKVDPSTVGQYIGLEDKNGTEIWEGDIVKWENLMKTSMRSVIRYIYNGFRFTYFDGEDQEIWCYSFEVIGNIHDNPELLKGGE